MLKTSTLSRREKRHLVIRKKVVGTAERPRFSVNKSLRHLYLQLIDDASGKTLVFVTTNTKDNKATGNSFSNVANGSKIGKVLAEKAKAAGIENVVFDRGGYRYHGVVKAIAEAAREAGLKF